MPQNQFRKNVLRLALPVTLQSVLQSSFSLVDQVMVGQLGSVEIAAIGLAGKFFSIYTVMAAAVSTVAGILLAQAVGAGDADSRDRSFRNNLLLALVLGLGFMTPCVLVPRQWWLRRPICGFCPCPACLWRHPRCWRPCCGVWKKRLCPCTPELHRWL